MNKVERVDSFTAASSSTGEMETLFGTSAHVPEMALRNTDGNPDGDLGSEEKATNWEKPEECPVEADTAVTEKHDLFVTENAEEMPTLLHPVCRIMPSVVSRPVSRLAEHVRAGEGFDEVLEFKKQWLNEELARMNS
eukprot:Gregarina_sp_Poly_1__271@NODE_1066_length_5195_cov_212_142551_g741_i0_p6_GENE_NODE_1066_length_5195_cov_212_142551_g741_i0NODE_1066_length_5195_cov_212_142551_g741_i0_p6_ORF_typecomplete_len149_score25_99_NODE_1066_length_5195_cov_212_142551_g741_i047495159